MTFDLLMWKDYLHEKHMQQNLHIPNRFHQQLSDVSHVHIVDKHEAAYNVIIEVLFQQACIVC